MKPSHLILLLVLNFFWAGVYSAYKVIGPALPAGGVVTIRFGLAALSFLVLWPWLPGAAPRGRDLAVTVFMGLILFTLGQRLQVYGNEIGTAGNSAVLMAVEPLLTSIAAALFLAEHIGPRRFIGFGMGLVGVAVLNRAWRPDFHWTSLTASVIFISSFICEAAFSVLGKPIVSRAGVMKMLAIALVVGTAGNLIIDGSGTIAAAKALTPKAWIILLALALICTTVGYTCWFVVIRETPVNVAALTVFAQSVFGVIIAALWAGEALHWGHLFGSLTIVVGLVIGLSRQVHKSSPARPITSPDATEGGSL